MKKLLLTLILGFGLTFTQLGYAAKAVEYLDYLTVSPTNSKIIYYNVEYSIYKSTDGGSKWVAQYLPYEAGVVHSLLALSDTVVEAATGESGIYESRDGGPWKHLDLSDIQWVFSLSSVSPNVLYVTSEMYGVQGAYKLTYSEQTKTWSDVNIFRGDNLTAISALDNNIIYIGQESSWDGTTHGVYNTSDGGAHWTQINNGIDPDDLKDGFSIKDLKVTDSNTAFIQINSHLYKFSNKDQKWTKMLVNDPSTPDNQIDSFTTYGSSLIYALTSGGHYLNVSTDGGQKWKLYKNSVPFYAGYNYSCSFMKALNKDTLLATMYDRQNIYKGTNGTSSVVWTELKNYSSNLTQGKPAH